MQSFYVPLPHDLRLALTLLAARELRRGCYDRTARDASRGRSWLKRAERLGRCPWWREKRARSNHRRSRRARGNPQTCPSPPPQPPLSRHSVTRPSQCHPSLTANPLPCNPPPNRDA